MTVLAAASGETIPGRASGLLESLFSFPALLVALSMCWVDLLVSRSIVDPDILWHLRDVACQLQTHRLLRTDLYSFTAHGAAWINHEWLAELPFYLGWRLMGPAGLVLVTLLAIEAIFLGVFYLCYRYAGEVKSALPATALAAFLSTISFGPRTLLFGWLALLAELLLLHSFVDSSPKAQRRAAWMLPCLFAVWVNTHGSWLIGLVILSLFVAFGWFPLEAGRVVSKGWTPEQKRLLTGACAGSVAALFLNPYGWRLVLYPFDLAFRQKLNIANVEEWAVLDFHSLRAHIFLLSLLLLGLAQLVRRRQWAPYELAYAGLGIYASFTYSRFLFLAAILICPLLAREMTALVPRSAAGDRPRLNAAIVLLLLIFAIRHQRGPVETSAPDQRAFPEKALPFLKAFRPQGNIFTDYYWGGYLELYTPHILTFVDSRIDIFEYAGVFKDYLDATRLSNTLAIFDKYRIRYVLFREDAPMVYLLRQLPAWKVDYQDGTTILLERADTTAKAAK